jgi:hypothetical protein
VKLQFLSIKTDFEVSSFFLIELLEWAVGVKLEKSLTDQIFLKTKPEEETEDKDGAKAFYLKIFYNKILFKFQNKKK